MGTGEKSLDMHCSVLRQGHVKDLYIIVGKVRGIGYDNTTWGKYLKISAVNNI